ncbi:hypothetical protein EVC45_27790 [Paraburkholderia sp. UYCP14C]|nr:hypothetical protein EVC45_27790 [Paraburkholderia sp. UYCP14C]
MRQAIFPLRRFDHQKLEERVATLIQLTPKSLEGRISRHVRKLTIGILSGNRHLRRCQFKL